MKFLNFAADYYSDKYPRSRLLWVDKNEIAEWLMRGAKIVPLDPLESNEHQTRKRQNPGSIHVQHDTGTTLFRMRPRLYDRYRLAPTRRRMRVIRAAYYPVRGWWAPWRYRIKALFRWKRRGKEEKVRPAPATYYADNSEKLHAVGFDVDESETAFKQAQREHQQ